MSSSERSIQENGLKPWEPAKLSERHLLLATLIAAGWKNHEIAQELQFSESRVSILRNDPRILALTREVGRKLRDETAVGVRERFVYYSTEAIETIAQLMRHAESEQVRLAAGKDILDRAGHKPREHISVASVQFSGEEVIELVKTLREAREPEAPLEFVEDSSGVFMKKEATVSARK